MTSITYSPVTIQTSPRSEPSIPPWFGEVALMTNYLSHLDVLSAIGEQVRFARRRFGHYEVIDFVAVLLAYAISGEHTLETFYERLQPFALPFMALFGRERLPHRSTLSRFLASLDQVTVEALRTLFLDHLLARPPGGEEKLDREEKPGGLWDRQGGYSHGLRNEIIASKLYSTKRFHEQSRSHCLLGFQCERSSASMQIL